MIGGDTVTQFERAFGTAKTADLGGIDFWRPKQAADFAWIKHAPFWAWLLGVLRPATCACLGAACGEAYLGLRTIAARVDVDLQSIVVDDWANRTFGPVDGKVALDELRAAEAQAPGQRARFVDKPLLDAANGVADGSLDLLYVNAANDHVFTPALLQVWLPKLSTRGVVLVDGIPREGRVALVWADLAQRYPSFEFTQGAAGGVIAIGREVPAALQTICAADDTQASIFRAHFGALGREFAGHQRQERLAHAEAELDAMRQQLAANEAELAELRVQLARASRAEQEAEQDCAALQERLDAALDDLEHESEALRATNEDVRRVEAHTAAVLASTSWRMTAPLRLAITTVRSPGRAVSRVKGVGSSLRRAVGEHGWLGTMRKGAAVARRSGLRGLLSGAGPQSSLKPVHTLRQALPARNRLALRVLIVAELSIPQCRKYRVTQKQQMIRQLGIDCTVVSWTEYEQCRSLLQTHSAVIFYRVPGFPNPLRLIHEAKSMGLATFWEVDDLIFDAQEYAGNTNLAGLSDEMRRGVMEGAVLYREAMLACDYGIASTEGLAEAMRRAGLREVSVVENALDKETHRIARKLGAVERARGGILRIVYGSGTKTHDADFRVAAGALKRVLKARPNVHLVVIGELNLPADFSEVQAQVERLPLSDYPTYVKRLASCDISIAPLEDSVFNDAKSNIKYIEAAIVRMPSVCSASAAFRTAIKHGETGFLAADDAAWEVSLLALVDDATLRVAVGQQAYEHVSVHYAPSTVATEQVAPILAPLRQKHKKLRVLAVNIYFEPRSFGGATVVAEEVSRRLNQRDDIEYAMFTTLPTSDVASYRLVRYAAAGGDAFAMGLPHESNPTYGFENPNSVAAFAEAVRTLRPDVVHLHSIQGIGAQIAEVCQRERIPFVVTLHDAWWICGRQFMITGENQYCYQRKIDLNVCARCVDDASMNTYRQFKLREILQSASLLLAPSAFFKQLHIENGFEADRIVVNKNGIRAPQRPIRREPLKGRRLRIGYVGGETPVKGAPLVRKAMRSLAYTNYELLVVDNVLNLGRRSIDPSQWAVPGGLTIVPAYTQETIDDFFESVDVLLFPTQCKESFGLSVREALIRDVWVITTDAGGAVEDIVEGENGNIIALEDDGSALAASIGRLLENPAQLDGYRNPHAKEIRVFEEQADELNRLLAEVVAREKLGVLKAETATAAPIADVTASES